MRVLKIIGTRSLIRIVKLLFDKKMEFRQLVNWQVGSLINS
jgi:hypothetical protein